MSIDKLPFNFFDFALVVFLGLGLLRGRKHGMSQELFNLIKWIAVLAACTLSYKPLGQQLASSAPFSLLTCYVFAYVGLALLILGAFALVKHRLGDKLVGSDVFGRSEYYLGMGSGLIRFACILLAGLALLNARYFSPNEVRQMEAYQNDVYGSNYFPGLHSAQSTVFERSMTGPWIRQYLGFMLITPTQPENKDLHQREYALPTH